MIKIDLYGFSWTYLFFGWFVPLFSGELGVGALNLLFTFCALGFCQLIACFIYNKQYVTRMLTNGWVLACTDQENVKARVALNIAS